MQRSRPRWNMSPLFERWAFRDKWPLASDFSHRWSLTWAEPGGWAASPLQKRQAQLESGRLKERARELGETEGGFGAHLAQTQTPDTNGAMVIITIRRKAQGEYAFEFFVFIFLKKFLQALLTQNATLFGVHNIVIQHLYTLCCAHHKHSYHRSLPTQHHRLHSFCCDY